MKCTDFEKIINDLARERIRDAVTLERGLAHADSCARCSVRLADERSLNAGLQMLAANDEGKAAPAQIETTLLAAFRQNRVAKSAPPAPAHAMQWSRRRLAAAALILIALGLIAFGALRMKSSEPKLLVNRPPSSLSPTPAAAQRDPGQPVEQESIVTITRPQPDVHRRGTHLGQRVRYRREGATTRNRLFVVDGITLYASDREEATDFLLLSSSGSLVPLERWQVIRVQVPRSALVSFGLPMNAERADVPVKADLLVGEDNLARAIRFVR